MVTFFTNIPGRQFCFAKWSENGNNATALKRGLKSHYEKIYLRVGESKTCHLLNSNLGYHKITVWRSMPVWVLTKRHKDARTPGFLFESPVAYHFTGNNKFGIIS